MNKTKPEYKWQEFSKKDLLIFALSGFLCALAFFSKHLGLISFVGLVPAFALIFKNNYSIRSLYALGFMRSYIFYFFVYSWFCELYPLDFLGLDKLSSLCIVLVAMLFIPLLHSLIFGFAYVLMGKIKHCKPLAAACVWVIFEYIQSLGDLAFPWAKISISVYEYTPFIQSAELFGNYFISFLVVLINSMLAFAYCHKNNIKKEKVYALGALLIFCANWCYGFVRMTNFKRDDVTTINAAIIQGNVNSNQKWSYNSTSLMLEKYSSLMNEANDKCKKAQQRLDLVVLPETAIPVSLDPSNNNLNAVGNAYIDFCRQKKVNMIVGAFWDKDRTSYNSSFFIDYEGKIGKKPYSKRHLVPFGEYVPFRKFLEIIAPDFANMNALGEDLSKGTSTSLAQAQFGKIGSLVCFDSIFDNLARQSTLDGANILCVITNDSWYGDSVALKQHLAQAVYRAVENRRYVLRAANTGISACVGASGEITDSIGANKTGYILCKAGLGNDITLYTKLGNIIIAISAVFAALMLVLSKRK